MFPEITPLLREHNFVSTTQKSRERYHFGYSGAPTIPKKSISLDLRMIKTSLFARRRIEFFANVGAVIFRGTLSKKLLSDLAHTYTKRAINHWFAGAPLPVVMRFTACSAVAYVR